MERMFEKMIQNFNNIELNATYYLNVDDRIKKTIVTKDGKLTITDGKPENADCVIKVTEKLLKKVWEENYSPGLMDIATGSLKTNNPDLLGKLFKSLNRG
ncbi:hypothetical protein [Calditerrivibrio nitroreducens]|uniref:SCP2 domain-containing protein n=1 Tax=Calditerrivibrio nitroreducens (strain DSM 19672 / NBRC 101217 / Yu37-1) TaxID=768670 RepID=E4TK09_CALNY|nr:hypothetical protein [Calditerrivibrio nitroreducens]ADR18260.1 hypothetical protein Calni_0347 [Calditerrivibrio nitroreducens DSM 19672]